MEGAGGFGVEVCKIIADSYYSEYWQSQVFHLTRTPQELPESSDYTQDLDLAECHLYCQ